MDQKSMQRSQDSLSAHSSDTRNAPSVVREEPRVSFLKQSWLDLRSEGKKKAIAAILSAVSGVLAYTGRTVWKESRITWTHIDNLSKPQADVVASKLLGNQIFSTIPFRETNDPKQYILAVMNPSTVEQTAEVYLLTSDGDIFRSQRLGQDACLGIREDVQLTDVTGVLDLRHDGSRQVFSSCTSGGSGAYGTDIFLFDLLSNKTYVASTSAGYDETNVKLQYTGETPSDPAIKEWFQETFKKNDASKTFAEDTLSQEEAVWRQANPKPFQDQLHFHTYPGFPPDEDFENGLPEFGNLVFYMVPKGPILAYDTKADNHFIFYAGGEYDWYTVILQAPGYLFLLNQTPSADLESQLEVEGIVFSADTNHLSSFGDFMFHHAGNITVEDAKGVKFVLQHWPTAPPPDDDNE